MPTIMGEISNDKKLKMNRIRLENVLLWFHLCEESQSEEMLLTYGILYRIYIPYIIYRILHSRKVGTLNSF